MPRPKAAPKKEPIKQEDLPSPGTLPTPSLHSKPLRMSYRIARGEQGVLTFEPYKSLLLPYWRFKTAPIAHTSSSNLLSAFNHYVSSGDFVGADMSRKFIQMGMTRAKRYGNYKGGRKYDVVNGAREKREKSRAHEGKEEKDRASEVFRGVWRGVIEDGEYGRLKGEFLKEQKEWDKMVKKREREGTKGKVGEGEEIKMEKVEVKEEDDED